MEFIKIALGDLRHKTAGRHSVFMPIGIGFIASYLLSQIDPRKIKIKLYDDADALLADTDKWNPDIIGLSNYCWNNELSKLIFNYAKQNNPAVVCIAGGPDFPAKNSERQAHLNKMPAVDFYVYTEGEVAFTELIKKILQGKNVNFLKMNPQGGAVSIHPINKKLVYGLPLPRLLNLDSVPSPYINGIMDQWFNGYFAPSIQTTRGCPFTCGYCFDGQGNKSGLATFSIERIKNELTNIAQRMKKFPSLPLSVTDSNFGMYPRDEAIAEHISKLQDEYGWPNFFDITTGKTNYDLILRISDMLKNKMVVTCSVQSLNPKTLEIIKRKNLPMDEYKQLQKNIKKRGMRSVAEFIVPLPEETKISFFEGMKKVIEAGVEIITPYTTMVLKGTYLASNECRQQYQMQTKFRLIPRQFGEYCGNKCFEIEEVCVATSTMSFEEYLEIRGFALIFSFFSGEQFDVIRRHLNELNINCYDFFYLLWDIVKSGKSELSTIYDEFLHETKDELWGSKEELENYFSSPENYAKLLKGDLGDNLIRKYSSKLLIECCVSSIDLAYSSIQKMAQITDDKTISLLNAARTWLLSIRNLTNIFKYQNYKNYNKILEIPYDVDEWYHNVGESLSNFKKHTVYELTYPSQKLDEILSQATKLYGTDQAYRASKLLANGYWDIKNFWCHCKKMPTP